MPTTSVSRTPLPAPPSTCFDGVLDGLETDIDCGGNAGCPRCAVGRACMQTLDCVSVSSAAAQLQLLNLGYTGQEGICTLETSGAGGTCTDVRLSLSAYSSSPATFVEFTVGFFGVPVAALGNLMVNATLLGVWAALQGLPTIVAANLIPEDVILLSASDHASTVMRRLSAPDRSLAAPTTYSPTYKLRLLLPSGFSGGCG